MESSWPLKDLFLKMNDKKYVGEFNLVNREEYSLFFLKFEEKQNFLELLKET